MNKLKKQDNGNKSGISNIFAFTRIIISIISLLMSFALIAGFAYFAIVIIRAIKG